MISHENLIRGVFRNHQFSGFCDILQVKKIKVSENTIIYSSGICHFALDFVPIWRARIFAAMHEGQYRNSFPFW